MKKLAVISFVVICMFVCFGCDKNRQMLQTNEPIAQNELSGNRVQNPNHCESRMLSSEDAQKWECAPEIGYWCMESAGCPIQGNTVMVDARLEFIPLMPEGNGYRLTGKINTSSHHAEFDSEHVDGEAKLSPYWECTDNKGCKCGDNHVDKGTKCFGNTTDEQIQLICTKESGCNYDNNTYAYHQKWNDSSAHYDSLLENKTTREKEQKAAKLGQIPEGYEVWREDRRAFDNGTSIDKLRLLCTKDDGCACSSNICPKDYACQNGHCMHTDMDEFYNYLTSYCDKSEGCACGTGVCPQWGFCKISYNHIVNPEQSVKYECFTLNKKFNREKEVIDFMQTISFDYHHSGKSCGINIKRNPGESEHAFLARANREDTVLQDCFIMSDEEYMKKFNIPAKTTLFIEHHLGGKKITSYFCKDIGCDCGGTPLVQDYICYKQHVVMDIDESITSEDYGICKKPYADHGPCEISDDVFEQVCDNDQGCECGTGKIKKGDICVDGKAQCSTLDSGKNCLCGNSKLDKNYACYHGQLICQPKRGEEPSVCDCNGQKIHLGDICTKDKVICGANARHTPGCMCGDKPLREGYRCLDGKQYCYCYKDLDDVENAGSKDCTCKCGEQNIQNGMICTNDDKPVIVMMDVPKDKDGADLLSCGEHTVRVDGLTLDSRNQYWLNTHSPDDQEELCTCGTGHPVPGDGYGCAFEESTIGIPPEWSSARKLAGFQCQNYDGCSCGDEICRPGDICDYHNDSLSCRNFLTVDVDCNHHHLPISKVREWGYGCYNAAEPTHARGWYCIKEGGCPCGEAKCEQWQMCVSPGYCGKNKLAPEDTKDVNEIKLPPILSMEPEMG